MRATRNANAFLKTYAAPAFLPDSAMLAGNEGDD